MRLLNRNIMINDENTITILEKQVVERFTYISILFGKERPLELFIRAVSEFGSDYTFVVRLSNGKYI